MCIGVATTGVEGLKTIIPEAAISNWYAYYRTGGLNLPAIGWQGDDLNILAKYCFSRAKDPEDYENIKEAYAKAQDEMIQAQDRATGNYNRFWDERNYLNLVDKIKASVFIVHGINDWNVKTNQCIPFFEALEKQGIPAKMMLHQGEHVYIHTLKGSNMLDIMYRWLEHYLKGVDNGSIVVEGQVPDWKKFGQPQSTKGYGGTWGLPRFKDCDFEVKFPFAKLRMSDDELKMDVTMKVWNPFIPTDENNSGLPVAGFEYTFKNKYAKEVEAIFSYNSKNFVDIRNGGASIRPIENGFIISQKGTETQPFHQADFAIFTDEPETKVNYCWFRGWSFDSFTMCWNEMSSGVIKENPANMADAPGASLYVPFRLQPGESKTIRLYMAWYVPFSLVREGLEPIDDVDVPIVPVVNERGEPAGYIDTSIQLSDKYRPWYSSRFANIEEVADYWMKNYNTLKEKTELFTDAFYATTLPAEVVEAVAANLTILKSPTIFRQYDGRMWNWEGCGNEYGSCYGSCTHVWNYAQAIPHLFPKMERTLRETEFFVSQAKNGHQAFRSALPIRPIRHNFHAAADGLVRWYYESIP